MPTNNEKRKKYTKEYQKLWMRRRRTEWINENGPCKKCGTWNNLEVDHIDPNLKTIKPSSLWSRSLEIRLKELANCQVLCKSCHLEKTLAERPKAQHGTVNMYDDHACRCDECREAKRKNQMRLRNPKKYKELYGNS